MPQSQSSLVITSGVEGFLEDVSQEYLIKAPERQPVYANIFILFQMSLFACPIFLTRFIIGIKRADVEAARGH